jgi:hypothetical protein
MITAFGVLGADITAASEGHLCYRNRRRPHGCVHNSWYVDVKRREERSED